MVIHGGRERKIYRDRGGVSVFTSSSVTMVLLLLLSLALVCSFLEQVVAQIFF